MTSEADAGAVPMGRRSRAGRWLAAIWVLVLLGLIGGAAALQWLGPPRAVREPARAMAPSAPAPDTSASAPAATVATGVPASPPASAAAPPAPEPPAPPANAGVGVPASPAAGQPKSAK